MAELQLNFFSIFRRQTDEAIRKIYNYAYGAVDESSEEELSLQLLFRFILETSVSIYSFVPPQYHHLETCAVMLAEFFDDIKTGYLIDKDLGFVSVEGYGTLIVPHCYEPSKILEQLSLKYPTERLFSYERHRSIHRFIKDTDPKYIF